MTATSKDSVILGLLEKMSYKVFFPRAGIIEVVAVLKRSGMTREYLLKVMESLNNLL